MTELNPDDPGEIRVVPLMDDPKKGIPIHDPFHPFDRPFDRLAAAKAVGIVFGVVALVFIAVVMSLLDYGGLAVVLFALIPLIVTVTGWLGYFFYDVFSDGSIEEWR